MRKKYDFIFSIGTACCSSIFLRKAELQTYSYPLDWVAGLDFISRINLIRNNFKNWLNIEDLAKVGENGNPNIEAHDIYINKKTKMLFPHDFAYRVPLSVSYKEVEEKYKRRIARLYSKIKKSNRVLALYLHNPETSAKESDEKIIEGQKLLQEHFPKQIIDIIYVEYKADCNEPIIKHLNENVIRISYNYLNPIDGYESMDPKPCDWNKLKNVIKAYVKFNMPFKDCLTTYIIRTKRTKKGIELQFLPKFNTIFKIKLYLLGLRFSFCIGKNRENI